MVVVLIVQMKLLFRVRITKFRACVGSNNTGPTFLLPPMPVEPEGCRTVSFLKTKKTLKTLGCKMRELV